MILDASWSDADRRADATALARSTASTLACFVLSVPAEVADARARVRATAGTDASDATASVTGALHARFADWSMATRLDATLAPGALADIVLDRLQLSESAV